MIVIIVIISISYKIEGNEKREMKEGQKEELEGRDREETKGEKGGRDRARRREEE